MYGNNLVFSIFSFDLLPLNHFDNLLKISIKNKFNFCFELTHI